MMNSVTFQSSNLFADLHPLQAAFERMFSGEMSNQKKTTLQPCLVNPPSLQCHAQTLLVGLVLQGPVP